MEKPLNIKNIRQKNKLLSKTTDIIKKMSQPSHPHSHPEGSYFCSTCQCHLHEEKEYKEHYKSEFHRYNIKRKLLEFTPVTHEQFLKRKISK